MVRRRIAHTRMLILSTRGSSVDFEGRPGPSSSSINRRPHLKLSCHLKHAVRFMATSPQAVLCIANVTIANFACFTQNFTAIRCSFGLSILQSDKRKNTLYLKQCSLSTNEDICTRKRRFNQQICTNLATRSGYSWNQLEPRNSNSVRILWRDFIYGFLRLKNGVGHRDVFHPPLLAVQYICQKNWWKHRLKCYLSIRHNYMYIGSRTKVPF